MHQGQCLCGSVKITTAKDISHVSVCHCGMCQKWNGGPGFSVDCGNDLMVEGKSLCQFLHHLNGENVHL